MREERPVIPVVIPRLPLPVVGGAEKRTVRLLEALERAGGRPHLVSAEPADDLGLQLARDRGWDCSTPAAPSGGGYAARLRQHLARWPAPRRSDVAATVAHLAADAPFVQFEHTQSACYRSAVENRPCILSTHNIDSAMVRAIGASPDELGAPLRAAWRWRAMRATERPAAKSYDLVVCVSQADAYHFEGLSAQTIIVPNGVDDDLWTVPAPHESPQEEIVLFFGNLAYRPNATGLLRFLAEGWSRLREIRPSARLRIAGGGAPAELREAVEGAEGVELLGFVEDLLGELARCRLVVVPLWHGAGTRLKVLEAMAAGRPVVGTALGVERIGFAEGIHGLVGEDGPSIASATATLLDDPVGAAAMGRAARDHAESVRWIKAMRPMESAYAYLLAASRTERRERRWGDQ